jgi:4-diphosphocytidyl-2-C-methyl-D-erythritol kinase
MITFPKAKINLGLRVTGKRPDGYHDIETIFYPVSLSDALEFVILPGRPEDEIVVTGLEIKTKPENNLVIKALRRLRERHSFPVLKIHLHKAIPSGAGLGGGSSDAACMLKAINKYLRLNLSLQELKAIALDIGSDCPFFIEYVPSVATGRGEILKPLKANFLEGYYIILLNPGISISTKEAYYNTFISSSDTNLEQLASLHLSKWKKLIVNDFEDYAFKLYPVISEIKRSLYKSGAVYSSMSGSGSSVYGIFAKKPEITTKLRDYLIYEGLC